MKTGTPPWKLIKNKQRFAKLFKLYTHFSLRNMKGICSRAGVLTRTLLVLRSHSFFSWNPCTSTGRPLSSCNVSFSRLLTTSNKNVQVDFVFVGEMGTFSFYTWIIPPQASPTPLFCSQERENKLLRTFLCTRKRSRGPCRNIPSPGVLFWRLCDNLCVSFHQLLGETWTPPYQNRPGRVIPPINPVHHSATHQGT